MIGEYSNIIKKFDFDCCISDLDENILTFANQTISNLFNDKEFSDVAFKVGNIEEHGKTETFYCNRAIVGVQSDIFKVLLFGKNFAESSIVKNENKNTNNINEDDEPGSIIIPDVSPAGFEIVLKLFYLQDSRLTNETVIDVLYICEKYMLNKSIKNICLTFLKKYTMFDPSLILDAILKMKKTGLWNVSSRKQAFLDGLASIKGEKYTQLIMNPKLLYLDCEIIKKLLVANKLRKVSMENQWILIHRWSKFQIILLTRDMNKSIDTRGNININTNDDNYDDEKQKEKNEFVLTSLDDDDDDANDEDDASEIKSIEKENVTDKDKEKRRLDKGQQMYDLGWINQRLENVDMENSHVLSQWGQNMVTLVPYINFDRMNPVYFAQNVWPKLNILAKITNDEYINEVISGTNRQTTDGWYNVPGVFLQT